jgi:hypothetical protein
MKAIVFVVLLATAASTSELQVFTSHVASRPRLAGSTQSRFTITGTPPAAAPRFEYDNGVGASYFICPKDETMLRVPAAAPGATFKCPVDGTEMRRGVSREGRIFLID